MDNFSFDAGTWVGDKNEVRLMPMLEYHEQYINPYLKGREGTAPTVPQGYMITVTDFSQTYRVGAKAKGALMALSDILSVAKVGETSAGRQARRKEIDSDNEYDNLLRIPRLYSTGGNFDCPNPGDEVKELVCGFVRRYGPLVYDFGTWINQLSYHWLPLNTPIMSEKAPSEGRNNGAVCNAENITDRRFFYLLGNESLIFHKTWVEYILYCYNKPLNYDRGGMVISAPLMLYIWAAVMFSELKENPASKWSRQFLQNRLAEMRLSADLTGRLQLRGSLLDYLTLAVYGKDIKWGLESGMGKCDNPDCEGERWFIPENKKFKYCQDCRNKKVQGNVRIKRHRGI